MFKRSLFIIVFIIIALLVSAGNTFALYYYGGNGDGSDFSVAGGLTSPAVSLSSSIASTTVTATVTFTNVSVVEANGDVQITFPTSLGSGFDLSGVGASDVTEANSKGGTLTTSVSGNVLTINCGSQIAASTSLSFAISNVVNPDTGGSTGIFPIETQDSVDNIIETAEAASLTIISYTIDAPGESSTVPTTFTVVGSNATASGAVQIKDESSNVIGSATADSNGKYCLVTTTALSVGAHTIQVYVDGTAGQSRNITVSTATPSGYPQITSPAENDDIKTTTPTVSGTADALCSLTFYANDSSSNIVSVGSGSADGSGTCSITATTALPLGSNEIYILDSTHNLASNVVSITLIDPYGVVFDSVSNNPIGGAVVTFYNADTSQAAVPGVEIAAADANPQTTTSNGEYNYNTIDGNYYFTVTAAGYTYASTKSSFPSGRVITTGSKGETFTVAGVILNIDLPMDPGNALLKIEKDANKKEVVVGDVVTYTVTIENETSSDVTSVYLEDKIPPGFKYISRRAILDNALIADPTGTRNLTFNIGTVSAGTTKTLKYQLVVGSGVTYGNYENTAFSKYSDGTILSNNASETVKVVLDPLFDLGTVIGKVFWDRNENGIQDGPERAENREEGIEAGIANIQIITEDGTLITTDKDGKFHLSAVIPGRHLFRLDERILPDGAYLTTDKVLIVDITPGILAKANFGISMPEGVDFKNAPFQITQDRDILKPRLNIALFNNEVIIKDGGLEEKAEFRIFTNYQLFIREWKLEILDKDTRRVIETLKGTKDNIFKPIYWDGKTDSGRQLTEGRNYAYVLTVSGKDGRQDVTKERQLNILSPTLGTDKKVPDVQGLISNYLKWIEQETKVNNLDKQNIRIAGETIRIKNEKFKIKNIEILKTGRTETGILMVETGGLAEKELLGSKEQIIENREQNEVEIILPKGEYDIKSGETYTKRIKVAEDYLFFVAMGDTKMGYTTTTGDIEQVKHDDKFKEGFWSEGKLAYYLKGKIKGKYLVTSSLDTERDKKELFRNLDPDKYYPVYGDASSVNYKATDTQGVLYLLVEWDKSKVSWGNYHTALTDTEFAQFSRTLYGGKAHLESVSTTKFGKPRTKLVVFRARAKAKAAHNEFTGTGGSLFYLKHRDMIDGSDKVKIEVRDKITGLILAAEEMKEGSDYEIDYSNSRITFRRPVSYITESSSIISSHLLDGNPVYVVVDYEYELKDKYDEGTVGVRVQKSLNDYLIVGGTYVKEEQIKKDYELRGADTTIHLGKDAKLTAEYAESKSEVTGNFISTDGGLTFTELPTDEYSKGSKAYGLKGEAYLLENRLGLSSYYKWIDNDFSTSATSSQQGKELIGFGATLDFTSRTRLTTSHDIQKLINDGNPQTQLQVGATKTETSSAQITHDRDRLKLTTEYQHKEVTEKKEKFESETNTEEDTVAIKAGYKLTKKVDVSLEQQATLKGTPNHQTTVGVEAKVGEGLYLRGKETIGTRGAATSIGMTSKVTDKFEVSGDYTKTNYKTGEVGDTASLSATAKLDEKTEVHSTYAVTDSMSGGKTQSLSFGSKRKVNEEVELTTQRTFASSKNKTTYGDTFGLVREKDDRRLEGTFTRQHSESSTEISNSNIFGLSGDINDRWAAQGTFERGIVQNHDGTQTTRNAAGFGLAFVDKDKETGEVRLKASSKIELRLDEGQEDRKQYLLYNAIEGKINPDTTLFAKANLSRTKNNSTDSIEAQYKELVLGIVYRPISFDWFNLLSKYTYLEDDAPSSQTDINDIEKEKAHVFAGEAIIDLTDKWQLSEKLAYKEGKEQVTGFDFTRTQTWLMIHRLNYNIDKDWQVAGEYRRLNQRQADNYKDGALVEVSRNIGEFIQIGAGYNFTDFNDDLSDLNYTAQGPFVRITGKFYDRTPQEIERAKEKDFEKKTESILKERGRKRFNKKASKEREKILAFYKEANNLYEKGKFLKAEEKYNEVLLTILQIEIEERIKVDERLEKEVEINSLFDRANNLYKDGKLKEARDAYMRCLEKIEGLKKEGEDA